MRKRIRYFQGPKPDNGDNTLTPRRLGTRVEIAWRSQKAAGQSNRKPQFGSRTC